MLAVRWYLRYGLSYRDVEELLAERDIVVDHELIDAARPSRHVAGDRWFVDETYLKVAGQWVYLYRAIDQHGQGHRRPGLAEAGSGGNPPVLRPGTDAARRPTEVTTETGPRRTRVCSTSSCPRRGTWWSSTQTTRSKPIMAG